MAATQTHKRASTHKQPPPRPLVKRARRAIDSYEKAVDRSLDLELKLVGMTRQEWLKSLIERQTDFAREVTETYTKRARKLLK